MTIQLRELAASDAETLWPHANNPRIADNLRDAFPHPYTLEDARAYIQSVTGQPASCCLAIVADGLLVGNIGVFLKNDVYRKSAEIGYWLAEPCWGRGIMTESIRQMTALAFERYDIARIFAEPYADNAGSRRALEKAGYQLEGILHRSVYKNGRFRDSCIYARIK